MWYVYALLSALFASLTAIFAKIGVKDVNSDLAMAIRTVVIVIIAWGIAMARGEVKGITSFKKTAESKIVSATLSLSTGAT